MTKITKPLLRYVGNYVIRLTVDGVEIREKRRRAWSAPLSWGYIHQKAWDTDGVSEHRRTRRDRKRKHFGRGFQI